MSRSVKAEPAGDDAPPAEMRVAILVRETDVDAANEILSLPADIDDGEDDKTDEADRLIDNWICPACKRRELVMLPPSRNWRRLRFGCLMLAAVPLVVAVLLSELPSTSSAYATDRLAGGWGGAAFFGMLICRVLFVVTPRGKRCKACGWKSDQGPGAGRNAE